MNRVSKNIIYNFAGNFGSKIISFFLAAFTTRLFGSVIYGQLNIALAEYSYFYLFANMGMTGYGLFLLAREQDSGRRQEIISDISSVRFIMGLVVAVVLLVYALLVPGVRPYLAPFSVLLVFQFTDLAWAFQALQDMKITAYGSIISIIINAAMLCFAFLADYISVYVLVISNVLSVMVLQVIYVFYLRRKHSYSISFRRINIVNYIKAALPYMVSGLFAGINTNLDMVILGYLSPAEQVGYYSAAYKLVSEFVALCTAFFTPMFPMFISKIAADEITYMNCCLGKIRSLLLSIIIPCAVIGVIYSGDILALVFGNEYRAGDKSYAILMVFVALLYYREIYGYTLTAAGKQSTYLRIVMVSALVNIIGNLNLIPKFGIVAAATMTLLSEIINLFAMRYFVRKKIGIHIEGNRILRLGVPLTIMIIVLLLCKSIQMLWVVSIMIGCGAYIVSWMFIKVIPLSELKTLFNEKSNVN